MAYATSASLRVRNPTRRQRSASRIVLKTVTGIAATGLMLAATGALAVGLLRLSSTRFDAPAETRFASRFGDAATWQAWNASPQIGAGAQHKIVASLALPASRTPAVVAATPEPPAPAARAAAKTAAGPAPHTAAAKPPAPAAPPPVLVSAPATVPAPDATVALAFAPPDRPIATEEPAVTGSVGVYALQSVSNDTVPATLAPQPGSAPLPRARPRLASLAPPDNPLLKPEPDARYLRTAIYDITAQTVYLPNGERLEAHSGFGPFMDDPRNVHRKMRGATPPNVYRLKLREALFHGVRAIRLTPENESDMFGRDGMLAHSYLLGPNGQSHGCVSFKDYPKFLRAFLRGEIDRMIVVARLDKPPTFFARRDVKSASNTF